MTSLSVSNGANGRMLASTSRFDTLAKRKQPRRTVRKQKLPPEVKRIITKNWPRKTSRGRIGASFLLKKIRDIHIRGKENEKMRIRDLSYREFTTICDSLKCHPTFDTKSWLLKFYKKLRSSESGEDDSVEQSVKALMQRLWKLDNESGKAVYLDVISSKLGVPRLERIMYAFSNLTSDLSSPDPFDFLKKFDDDKALLQEARNAFFDHIYVCSIAAADRRVLLEITEESDDIRNSVSKFQRKHHGVSVITVVTSGGIVPFVVWNRHAIPVPVTPRRPCPGGLLIASQPGHGTIGGALKFHDGDKPMGISCNHCISENQYHKVYQPYNNHQNNHIPLGTVEDFIRLHYQDLPKVTETSVFNKFDIAWFSGEILHGRIDDIGDISGFCRSPNPGEWVSWVGGMSGRRERGQIEFINGEVKRTERNCTYTLWRKQLKIFSDESERGDSGAFLIAEKDKMIVGILTGGPAVQTQGSYLTGCPIPQQQPFSALFFGDTEIYSELETLLDADGKLIRSERLSS
eukprot:TRINITY_DN10917_c0_g1_i1.p1 TRINITY_DN10917_c0_g1~~TRINITY_DN10917_c0_g1_i1.p1  ORF type:complete len:534 (-),score=49.94 TRINITY_DN10917_c0_g1_i1:33-1586(-)